MVTFPIGGLGDTPNRPGPGKLSGDQTWREPPRVGRGERGAPSGIDWENDPEYFTPQPAPKVHYGARTMELNDLPKPIERMINVRAVAPKTTYTAEGLPIAADHWQTVTVSPHILHAIAEGDLERGPDPGAAEEQETTARRARSSSRHEGVARRHEAPSGERRHHVPPVTPEPPAE